MLKRAKRARISFEGNGSLDGNSLVLDTELIRYKWTGFNGSFPDWQKLIPNEHSTIASFDTVEAMKAVNSLKALASAKGYAIDLAIGNGKVVMASPDDKGQAEINADTEGEAIKIRSDGGYLIQALKACGSMVELKLTKPYAPMLFTVDGYQLAVMPMATQEAAEQQRRDNEAKQAHNETEASQTKQVPAERVTDVVAEAEAIAIKVSQKPKRRHKVKEPVTVA